MCVWNKVYKQGFVLTPSHAGERAVERAQPHPPPSTTIVTPSPPPHPSLPHCHAFSLSCASTMLPFTPLLHFPNCSKLIWYSNTPLTIAEILPFNVVNRAWSPIMTELQVIRVLLASGELSKLHGALLIETEGATMVAARGL